MYFYLYQVLLIWTDIFDMCWGFLLFYFGDKGQTMDLKKKKKGKTNNADSM